MSRKAEFVDRKSPLKYEVESAFGKNGRIYITEF
jgi:hypothetical protein